MRLLIRLIAAAALVSLALPAAAQDKVRLLLDWFVNPDHAALVIAKQRGIFTKHGLDVELIAPADPNAPPKLVAAGQAEYALSYQPTLQMLAAEGLPLVRVGVLVAQPLNSLVVLEDGPVKTIADFKGRKIGYSIAGFEEALLGAILEKAGLTLKDVTLINVNFALTTALMSKQVDGVIGAFRNFELNDRALHKAKGRLWEVEKNGVPTYDELILVAKRETVEVARTKKLLKRLIATHEQKRDDARIIRQVEDKMRAETEEAAVQPLGLVEQVARLRPHPVGRVSSAHASKSIG